MKVIAGGLVVVLLIVVAVGIYLRFTGGDDSTDQVVGTTPDAASVPNPAPVAPLNISVVVAKPVDPWVRAAAEEYNGEGRLVDGGKVSVEVITMDGITAVNRWSQGNFNDIPAAWIAESRAWVDLANIGAVDRVNQDIFLTGGQYRAQPLVLSPVVWGIWEKTLGVLAQHNGTAQISWDELHEVAVAEGGWPDVGGPEDWGDFKLILGRPDRDPAGLTAMVGVAGVYFDKAKITTEDLQDPEFQAWLSEFLDTVIEFSPVAAENMLLFGRSDGDAGQIVESFLLINMDDFETRHNEFVNIVYPDPVAWFDFPYATYMGKETLASEKTAALDFKDFLTSTDQQAKALEFSLRPACVECPSTGGLISKWSGVGVKANIPSSSRMRPPTRGGIETLLSFFEDYDRQ